ncbi:Putative aminoacrylate hydrolase RutD [Streptomyces sp. enrichment culture]
MPFVTAGDGTEIFYKDWGTGRPVMFHHGWPLSADDWDAQMLFLVRRGYRVIAHDRRGHGRSAQVGHGHDMDHYAADAAAVVTHLGLRDVVHVGHSTGGGEVARYVARHGAGRVGRPTSGRSSPPPSPPHATTPATSTTRPTKSRAGPASSSSTNAGRPAPTSTPTSPRPGCGNSSRGCSN